MKTQGCAVGLSTLALDLQSELMIVLNTKLYSVQIQEYVSLAIYSYSMLYGFQNDTIFFCRCIMEV
jgi:hypothetical protein